MIRFGFYRYFNATYLLVFSRLLYNVLEDFTDGGKQKGRNEVREIGESVLLSVENGCATVLPISFCRERGTAYRLTTNRIIR